MSKMMMRSDRKPPLALRSPIRLRSRRPLTQSTLTNNNSNSLQTPSGSYTNSRLPKPSSEVKEPELRPEYQTISRELRDLTKMVQDTLRGSTVNPSENAGNPLFERGRFYEEYSAIRNERLKRKRGETGVEKSKQYLGVRMESAKKTVEVRKYESARKMTTPLVERREVATAQRVERKEPVTAQRYSLRSSTKENKKPPLAMSFERSMDAATVERKTTVRRTARKGYINLQDGKVSQLEHVFIRGSKVRFMIIPDMLKNAPMFKRLEARIKGKSSALGVGRGRAVAMRARAQAAGRGAAAGPGRGR